MKKIYCFTYSIKKSSLFEFELTPYVGIKKNVLNPKTQIQNWLSLGFCTVSFVRIGLCTKWSLNEMIPRRVYVKIQVPPRTKNPCWSDSYAFVRNGLPCAKWSLFEMVFVRSDLTPFYHVITCFPLHQ